MLLAAGTSDELVGSAVAVAISPLSFGVVIASTDVPCSLAVEDAAVALSTDISVVSTVPLLPLVTLESVVPLA